jgi:hypothetical protein
VRAGRATGCVTAIATPPKEQAGGGLGWDRTASWLTVRVTQRRGGGRRLGAAFVFGQRPFGWADQLDPIVEAKARCSLGRSLNP